MESTVHGVEGYQEPSGGVVRLGEAVASQMFGVSRVSDERTFESSLPIGARLANRDGSVVRVPINGEAEKPRHYQY